MNSSQKLSYAIAAILSGTPTAFALAAPAADAGDAEGIQEITVTAQRRTENLQNVPIAIQALTAETLVQLNVQTFDAMVKYLPNVSTASNGPGQGNIYMRGLSVGAGGTQGSGTNGQIPNVAVYLDDQSVALPGRNLDVYAADLERIEVLEGPQGTLFGSGAQAGVLRYITNKPKLDVTEGAINGGYSYTAHGDANSNVDAMINVPIIEDTLAARLVIYNDSHGGYINNVPATFTRYSTDEGLAHSNGGVVPTDSVSINNNNTVGNGINTVNYKGVRLSVKYKLNDSWDALLTQAYQNMDAQGVFSEMPFGPEGLSTLSGSPVGGRPLPELSVALFNPSYNKDKFESTALTINGTAGPLKLVYSGSYLVRNVDQVQDYTNYARGVFGYYYQCAGYSATNAAAGKCYSPSATWKDTQKNTHMSHEFRVSTPDDWRIRGIAGLFYENYKIYDDNEWLYKTVPTCSPTGLDVNCYLNIQPWAGSFANNPNVRNDNTGFFDDFKRNFEQKALFGSVDIDIIPKALTLTLGTRYYKFDISEVGGDVGSFYCKQFAPTTDFGPCGAAPGSTPPYGSDLNTQNPNRQTSHGFRSRANLSWKVTDEAMVYATWSQGYRPGGFNRGTSGKLPDANGVAQYITPATYKSDDLTNEELGWKTQWFSNRLQLNGAIYREIWKDAQVAFFDPQDGLGNLTFNTNGADYLVKGIELQTVAEVIKGLTVYASGSYNNTKQTNSPTLINNNPESPNFGQPIANPKDPTTFLNPFGKLNSPLANSPALQASVRIRYDWSLNEYKAFAQVGGTHQAGSYSATGNVQSYYMPQITQYDFSTGVAKDAWNVSFFCQNCTNVLKSTFTNASQFIITETVTRPRIAGVKVGYKF